MENLKSEVRLWLKNILKEENISDFTLEIEGNSEKGDGFTGEILFVNLRNPPKELYLALKCSNRSETLRTKTPLKQIFENEIYVYDNVHKSFAAFQLEKGVIEVFDSVPKFYGDFCGENVEVLVFENLKKSGYELWDKRKPITAKHIKMILKEYGKYHALSVAMRDQKPEKFKQLTDGLTNVWRKFCEATDMTKMFKATVEDALNLLKDEIEETTMREWLEFSQDINKIMLETPANPNYFSLVAHGDCWNNNFLFKIDENVEQPLKVAILDWQITSFSSPVLDLSTFIYCCGSKENLDNLEEHLKMYYSSFSTFAKKLGTDVSKLYPFSQLLKDWETVAKYGIIVSITAAKVCLSNKDETPNFTEAMENGLQFSDAFTTQLKDTSGFKNRARDLIEHAVKWRITKPNVCVLDL